ncbi:ribosomal protein L1 [Aureobasidium subglaciale]|nr:ribosomal protein L1 [Aureobasidium subglaciale]
MAGDSKSLTTKVESGSPYQLDPSQTLRASSALLKKISGDSVAHKDNGGKANLLEDADEEEDSDETSTTVWLNVTTKKHIADQRKMKPGKIIVPFPLQSAASPSLRICLITADPQRKYKDLIASDRFPAQLSSRITRVLGTEKLKAKYKTYEARRQLFAEYDIFLADDRIITRLPTLLGKVFYGTGAKRPIPVAMQGKPENARDEAGNKRAKLSEGGDKLKRSDITPEALAHEIERAVGAALVHLAPSTNVSIRVGKSSMTADQVAANIDAVISSLTEKYIPKGWRNIRSLHIKGPNTAALPIWLADELWEDEADVLDKLSEPVVKDKKKRKRALLEAGAVNTAEAEDTTSQKKRKSLDAADEETKAKKSKSDNAEKAARKAALKKQKEESKTAIAA